VRKRRSYEIALSAICTALILLLLWLSVLLRLGSVAFYVVCGGILMIPLTKKYYVVAVLSYVASSLLAFAVVGDIVSILGFVAYFGPMTMASVIMQEKGLKHYIAIPVKVVYINGVLALLYFVAGTFFVDLTSLGVNSIPYIVIALIATLVLLAIDFIMLYTYKTFKDRIAKIIRD